MFQARTRNSLIVICLSLAVFANRPSSVVRGADPANDDKTDAKEQERLHWENVILFYGDEATGEWSLRIQDKDVKDRAWFEFLELWHFNRDENRWEQLKAENFSRAIVLPKQKTSDEPPDSEMLVELKDIPIKTAGVWFAKWKVNEIEGSTLMRVGTARTANKIDGPIPKGMLKMAIPINLDKSEAMIVPDPRIYCVTGEPGKPVRKDEN